MSYQFFSEFEIDEATAAATEFEQLAIDDSFGGLEDISVSQGSYDFTIGEPLIDGDNFVYNAELTESYLNNGTINFNDTWNAETEATLNGWKSDVAFGSDLRMGEQTQAGSYIKQAMLHEDYLEKGYLDSSDVFNADTQAYLQGPLEEFNFGANSIYDLSPAGELIKSAHLTDTYITEGGFDYGDVFDAEMAAQMESPMIDYLF